MPKHLARGAGLGILAGIVLGVVNIVMGYLLDPLFLAQGMSLTGTYFIVMSLITGALYGLLFGGAYRIMYHSLPGTMKGLYFGLFVWAVSSTVSISDSIIFSRASIGGSALIVIMTLVSYAVFGLVLENLYERVRM